MDTSHTIKVAFLEPTLPVGGGERMLQALITGLTRDGFDTVVGLLGQPGAIGDELAESGIRVVHHLISGRLDPLALPKLVSFMRKESPDIVYTNCGPLNIVYGMLASRLARIPRFVSVSHGTLSIYRSLWQRVLLKSVIARLDKMVVISRRQQEEFMAHTQCSSDLFQIVRNGIDIGRFPSRPRNGELLRKLRIPDGAVTVGIVGVLRPEKRHDRFLTMAALVNQRITNAYFIIVGDGPEGPRLNRIAYDLGLADHVRFLGRRNDVPDILSAIDVVTLCSDREVVPVCLIEASAARRPIVAVDVGSVCEVVVDGVSGSLISPPDRVDLMADRVLELLTSPDKASAMGEAGRKHVEGLLTIERMVGDHEGLFRSLLSR